MSIDKSLRKLKDDWKLITSVAKKPDKDMLSYSIKLTLLVIAVVGVLSYIIQLTFTLLVH
ncbi:SecE/sec61-gamma family protein translocase subunit [Stygiolobus caldivivus]|uniref:Preprotein translocase subunit SecE n=1 Tax=Stygiolobus caldivivus TaxID=2824673 RepID=A0A8D5U849_9CREN|nr:preprotein translocase subunit SecE [Stygiolobus caldivivus]BCU70805.1 preprotein translocase subunit SecE [Stygiolobus caldivivus]